MQDQVLMLRELGMPKKKKKKTYFTFSNNTLSFSKKIKNTTLFMLPIHFTTHSISQFLFLNKTQ